MEQWWCLDCRAVTELDTHGRCEKCGSNAVAPTSTTPREFWLGYHAQYLTVRIEEA